MTIILEKNDDARIDDDMDDDDEVEDDRSFNYKLIIYKDEVPQIDNSIMYSIICI